MAILVSSSMVAQEQASNDVSKPSIKKSKSNVTVSSKVKSEKVINMYPNPANDIVTLQGVKEDDQIVISDVKGKKMIELKAKAQEEIILIESLPAGIYLLSINGENRKLVVQ
ncbi:MAG: T9SS type A sorting domain-containing protein [Flavobacterium sp.]|nr:T9SS type A sorting domain-containing protein [Flavobacterium sp.]